MCRAASALLCCLVYVGPAAAVDPLHTPECLQAQEALAAYERAPDAPDAPIAHAASAPSVPPRLRALRAQVARVCLASSLDAPRPQRQLQAPQTVPPVGGAQPLRVAPLGPVLPGQPGHSGQRPNPGPVAQPPLRSITSCDAGGCWASDGTRLQRMGPSLVGPQGACSVSGSVLSCP
jgi:hypothetical protein